MGNQAQPLEKPLNEAIIKKNMNAVNIKQLVELAALIALPLSERISRRYLLNPAHTYTNNLLSADSVAHPR
jgi:hypothetical protein